MRRLSAALAVVALLLALAPHARAQGTRGFLLHGRLLGATLSVENEDAEDWSDSGPGLGLRLGYGLSERFALYLAAEVAALEPEDGAEILENESYGLGALDLGVRVHFPAGPALVPYAEAALTGQAAVFDFEGTTTNVNVTGGGLTVGGGVQYFLSRTLALDVGLDLTFGRFTEVEVDGPDGGVTVELEEDAETVIGRLGAGLSFYPSRNRR